MLRPRQLPLRRRRRTPGPHPADATLLVSLVVERSRNRIARVAVARTTLLTHPALSDLCAAGPLGKPTGKLASDQAYVGSRAFFDAAQRKNSLKVNEQYQSMHNVCIIDPFSYPCKSAPFSDKGMDNVLAFACGKLVENTKPKFYCCVATTASVGNITHMKNTRPGSPRPNTT